MAKNWAICIGVNGYNNLPNLQFAKRDAEQMQHYFLSDVKFDRVYLFTDDSPPIDDADKPYASRPTYGALRRFLRVRFEEEFLSDGDNLWFFFSGHGIRHQDRDYLLPSDADPDPEGIEDTAIPISYVSERLRRCGADNVILLLDACRSEQSSKDMGIGYEKQQGVITFSSCSPAERSYEIETLEQGAFTYALLESLRIQGEGNCATVERLSQRIKYRVSELNRAYEKPKQTPYPMVEPASKYHLILLPDAATAQDITDLKNDAFKAEIQKEWNTAQRLWIRVNVAARGADMDVIEAIQRLANQDPSSSQLPQKNIVSNTELGKDISEFKASISLPSQPTAEEKLDIFINTQYQHFKRYQVLENFLKSQKFMEADIETNRVMLEAVGKASEEWLSLHDINTFPTRDLKFIDQLWIKYSKGKFGFSVQKNIWLDCGGIPDQYDWEPYERFAIKVRWMINDKWLSYSDHNFTLDAAEGHLPRRGMRGERGKSLKFVLFSRGDI